MSDTLNVKFSFELTQHSNSGYLFQIESWDCTAIMSVVEWLYVSYRQIPRISRN